MIILRGVFYSTIALVALVSFFFGAWFQRIMVRYPFGRRPVTGRESIIGLHGTVISINDGRITVRVNSQNWRAKTKTDRLNIGDRVIVEEVENLMVVVKLADSQE